MWIAAEQDRRYLRKARTNGRFRSRVRHRTRQRVYVSQPWMTCGFECVIAHRGRLGKMLGRYTFCPLVLELKGTTLSY
jgi:hypothetical protein